ANPSCMADFEAWKSSYVQAPAVTYPGAARLARPTTFLVPGFGKWGIGILGGLAVVLGLVALLLWMPTEGTFPPGKSGMGVQHVAAPPIPALEGAVRDLDRVVSNGFSGGEEIKVMEEEKRVVSSKQVRRATPSKKTSPPPISKVAAPKTSAPKTTPTKAAPPTPTIPAKPTVTTTPPADSLPSVTTTPTVTTSQPTIADTVATTAPPQDIPDIQPDPEPTPQSLVRPRKSRKYKAPKTRIKRLKNIPLDDDFN
ncbi:MAG: hypothetical protein AAF570_27430, partial [Bacteroidota bacterium]